MKRVGNSTLKIQKEIRAVTKNLGALVAYLSGLSGVINLLALTGSLYMMQIYDRALASGSVPTLLVISALAIGLYAFQGVLDTIRSQLLVRIGARLHRKITPATHRITIEMPRYGFSSSEAIDRGRDLDTVRGFLSGQGPIALFDLPWMPIFVVFVYALHPYLGALTLGGAVALTIIAVVTELFSRRLASEAHRLALTRNEIAESHARNCEVIHAMGFGGAAVERFVKANEDHLAVQARASDLTGTLGSLSKVLRMILQSSVLGLGALLTIKGEMSAGAIIAASVASARALAPIDMAIGNWKSFLQTRAAWGRLKDTLAAAADRSTPMDLPLPTASLAVENVTVAVPATGRVILSDISFEIAAGQAVGIIGPSGGGKTSLVRALTNIWPCLRGSVRLDGADLAQWSEQSMGRTIGYLPQDYGLFDTTIERNISRLQEPDPQAVVAAAKAAGIHEMILQLPEGYQTELGPFGSSLSAGQRQRIGLARAIYNDPFLVILDEPNANLDSEGEAAVAQVIDGIRMRGGIAVVIAHRPSALKSVDMVAVIRNGKLTAFGPRDDIIRARSASDTPGQDLPGTPDITPSSIGPADDIRRGGYAQGLRGVNAPVQRAADQSQKTP